MNRWQVLLESGVHAVRRWAASPGALYIVLLLALAVRLVDLESQSLRLDELVSAHWADPDNDHWGITHFMITQDSQMPLYYSLLRGCFVIWGYSQRVAELLSVVLGVGGVLAVYVLGRQMHSRTLGVLAATLAALQPFLVQYSHEVRFYPLAALLTPLWFWALLRGLERPALGRLLLWALLGVLSVYTYHYALYTWAMQAFIACLWLWNERGNLSRLAVARVLGIGLIPILLVAPALLSARVVRGIVAQASGAVAHVLEPGFLIRFWADYWGQRSDFDFDLFRFKDDALGVVLLVLLLVGLVVAGVQTRRKGVSAGLVLGIWIFGCLYAPYIHSLVVGNWHYWPRYAIGIVPGVLVGLAWLPLATTHPLRRVAIAGSLVALVGYCLLRAPGGLGINEKDDFKTAGQYLASRLDRYPIISHLDLQLNTHFKLAGMPLSALPISSPRGRNEVDTAQGLWVVRLLYYPYPDSAFDAALQTRFEAVRTFDDLNQVSLTLYERVGHRYAPRHDGQMARPVRVDSLVRQPGAAEGWIDGVLSEPHRVRVDGWGRLRGSDPTAVRAFVLLQGTNSLYAMEADYGLNRRDLPSRRQGDQRAGFRVQFDPRGLPEGRYSYCIWLLADRTGQQGLIGPIAGHELVVGQASAGAN